MAGSDDGCEKQEDGKAETRQLDVGWAWVIVAASFTIQFIGDGMANCLGIFFTPITAEFPAAGKSGVGWIAAILQAVLHCVGPFGSGLINRFGCRTVSITGSTIAAIGFALTYFANSVLVTYITVGLIGGLGFGLLYMVSIVAVPEWFDKRRSFALGIASCGSGIGTMGIEKILNIVLLHFEWRTGFLIAGGILLISSLVGLLYKPLIKKPSKSKLLTRDDQQIIARKKNIDFSVWTDPFFIILGVSNVLQGIGYNVPYLYLPGIEESAGGTSSTLLGIIGVSSVLSRIILGYLTDSKWLNRVYLLCFGLTISGAATVICPHLVSLWPLRVYAGLYGTLMGIYVSLKTVVLAELLGISKLTDAFGFQLLIQTIGFLIGPPAVGALYDTYGDYIYGFYFAGGTLCLSGLVLLLIPVVQRCQSKREKELSEMDTVPTCEVDC